MEWEMWRRVLLIFFVVGKVCGAEWTNRVVFVKLCDITRNVSALMEKEKDSVVTNPLKKALYGADGQDPFDNGGTFTVNGCGLGHHGRSQYCSHLPGGGSNGHGCFAHSLLGTFLCLCTKGSQGEQDLCGLDIAGGGAGWISWDSHVNGLFQNVWEVVKKRCITESNTTTNTSVILGNLESAVEEIKNQAQNKKLSNGKDGHYLGSGTNTNTHCDGTSPGDACVTYPTKAGTANEPHIPWADTILNAVKKLKEAIQRQTKSDPLTTGASHQGDHEDLSGHEQVDKQEGEEEEEQDESAENPSSHNTSTPPRSRRKRRSTKKQSTEQPAESLKAILHHDDGSFLPQPFWLLNAVVI